MTTVIDECQIGLGAIRDFMASSAAYLSSGGTPPSSSEILSSLDYSESLTFSVNQTSESAWFGTGASQESMSYLAAGGREISMAHRGKSELFAAAVAEYGDEATYYRAIRDFYVGLLRGAASNGSQ